MSIQWFPGHMAKARREVMEKLKLVDVVVEILDARLPESSRNPMMREITQSKPTVIVLGKADMADPAITDEFCRSWGQANLDKDMSFIIPVDNVKGSGLPKVIKAAQRLTEEKFAKLAQKGIRRRTVRAMVLGIPNVGKSSFINRVAGKGVTQTGDKPGITRQQQWIKVGKEFELLDTPGILWPKFDDRDVALRLAWSGAIKSTLLQNQELARELLNWMSVYYPERLVERYGCQQDDKEEGADLLEYVAKRRGALQAGGKFDLDLAADMLLRDLQTGLLGRISFERPH